MTTNAVCYVCGKLIGTYDAEHPENAFGVCGAKCTKDLADAEQIAQDHGLSFGCVEGVWHAHVERGLWYPAAGVLAWHEWLPSWRQGHVA